MDLRHITFNPEFIVCSGRGEKELNADGIFQ